MGLVICFCCGRQREVKPIKKGARYTCSHCGAKWVKIIRSRAHAGYTSWTDKEGVDVGQARHSTYAGLRGYAERRGYKNGWISNKFKEIFGCWPNGESCEAAAPAGGGLLHWIRKGNSAYARGKREEELRLANMGGGVSVRGGDGVDVSSSLMTDDDWGVKL